MVYLLFSIDLLEPFLMTCSNQLIIRYFEVTQGLKIGLKRQIFKFSSRAAGEPCMTGSHHRAKRLSQSATCYHVLGG